MPKIEFTAGAGLDFTPLPKGTYNWRVRKVEAKPPKSADKSPTVWVNVEVLEGEYEAKKSTLFCTLKKDKAWQLRELLQACIPGKYNEVESGKDEDGKPVFGMEFDTDDLIDTTFTADLTIENDQNGKPQNRFNKVRAHEVGGPETVSASGDAAPAESAGEAPQEAAPSLRRRMTAS